MNRYYTAYDFQGLSDGNAAAEPARLYNMMSRYPTHNTFFMPPPPPVPQKWVAMVTGRGTEAEEKHRVGNECRAGEKHTDLGNIGRKGEVRRTAEKRRHGMTKNGPANEEKWRAKSYKLTLTWCTACPRQLCSLRTLVTKNSTEAIPP